MQEFLRSRWVRQGAPLALIVLGGLMLLAAPPEQTLGQHIKIVYAHVAFSRAGAIAFYAAGLVGLVVMFTSSEYLSRWMRAIGWAGLVLFVLGFGVSIIAQAVSWGGISWQEPRVSGALNLLAVAVLVQGLNTWLPSVAGRGGLRVLLALYQLWTALQVENILHPGNAISSSSSVLIRVVGWGLLAVALLLGAWLVWMQYLNGGWNDLAATPAAEPDPGEG